MIAYKLAKIKNGKLYPLYVYSNEEFPVGEVIKAKPGEITTNGKVKSKLGELAYRPGLHLTTLPLATHIGKRMEDGTLAQAADTVWCECEVNDSKDYTELAREKGRKSSGKVIERDAYLKTIPEDGFYFYTTNSQAVVPWIIAGEMKILRILSNEEVKEICNAAGFEAQKLA